MKFFYFSILLCLSAFNYCCVESNVGDLCTENTECDIYELCDKAAGVCYDINGGPTTTTSAGGATCGPNKFKIKATIEIKDKLNNILNNVIEIRLGANGKNGRPNIVIADPILI